MEYLRRIANQTSSSSAETMPRESDLLEHSQDPDAYGSQLQLLFTSTHVRTRTPLHRFYASLQVPGTHSFRITRHREAGSGNEQPNTPSFFES